MEELRAMGELVQSLAENKLEELRSVKAGTPQHERLCGELSAYNDVVTAIIGRINLLEKEGKN